MNVIYSDSTNKALGSFDMIITFNWGSLWVHFDSLNTGKRKSKFYLRLLRDFKIKDILHNVYS